jgi:hypothetical protein
LTLTSTASPTTTATITNTSTNIPLPTATATASSTPTITLTLTATPTPTVSPTATVNPTATEQPVFTPMTYVGIAVEDTSNGVSIVSVSDSAAAAGVMVGDYVDGVDFIRVTTKAEFLQAMSAKEPYSRANLRLHRGDQTLFILVTLGAFDFTSASPTAAP